jgi:hypothetical protein
VSIRHFALVAAAAVTLSSLAPAPALSRMWKATPDAIAREYATINDARPGGELILLIWFVPRMVQSNISGADIIVKMLQKYVVVMAVHGRLDKTTGTMSFDDINELEARNQSGKPLAPVEKNDLPPTNTGMLAAMETMFRQSAGAMGRGMKMFVFDGADTESCKPGRLSVLLANETYTWDTPFPGCQQN